MTKADHNATQEQKGAGAAAPKTETSALGEAARKPSAGDAKSTAKAAAKDGEASGVSQKDHDALRADYDNLTKERDELLKEQGKDAKQAAEFRDENDKLKAKIESLEVEIGAFKTAAQPPEGDPPEVDEDFDSIAFRVRGILMSIIIKLPMAARYRSDVDQLDQMFDFVNSYETGDERMVAVELIKSVGEVDMNKIASGVYKTEVQVAMAAIRGEAFSAEDIRSADSQQAASDRLQLAFSGGRMPEIPEAMRADLAETTRPRMASTAEQDEAAERLASLSGSR